MTYYMNPHPALARSPLPSLGEGTGVRAGYRNCLYGHDNGHDMRRHRLIRVPRIKPANDNIWLSSNTTILYSGSNSWLVNLRTRQFSVTVRIIFSGTPSGNFT